MVVEINHTIWYIIHIIFYKRCDDMKYRLFDVNDQDYIKVIMDEHNIFTAKVSFEILEKQLSDVDVKIDTGCNYSRISALTIGFTKEEALEQKELDLKNNVPYYSTRNSSTTESQIRNDRVQRVLGRADRMVNVVFGHIAHNIKIAGMRIDDMEFKVSYDTNHPMLLGMDVLKQFDIHIHKTEDDKTILLACPLYYMSEKYKQAVIDLMQH